MLHATRSAARFFFRTKKVCQVGGKISWEWISNFFFIFYINNGTLTGKDTIGQIERNNNNITIVFEIISEINQ